MIVSNQKLENDLNYIETIGYKVFSDDEELGEVRSGIFSPSLGHGIATAFVPRSYSKLGTKLQVEVRGKREAAVVVKPPFYKNGSHK